jgi:hypothetical protein
MTNPMHLPAPGSESCGRSPSAQRDQEAFAAAALIFAAAGITSEQVEPYAVAEDAGMWPGQARAFRPLADALRALGAGREYPAATS